MDNAKSDDFTYNFRRLVRAGPGGAALTPADTRAPDGAGWLDAAQYPPTEADMDKHRTALCWHRYQGCMVQGWANIRGNRFITHWRPTPPAPEAYQAEEDAEDGEGTKPR